MSLSTLTGMSSEPEHPEVDIDQMVDIALSIVDMTDDEQDEVLAGLSPSETIALNKVLEGISVRTDTEQDSSVRTMELLPHQITPDMQDTSWSGLLLMGGRGAGKTFTACAATLKHVWGPPCDPQIPGGHRMLIVGPSQIEAIDSCVLGPSGLTTFDPTCEIKSSDEGTIVRWQSGAVARMAGARDKEDVERIRSRGNTCFGWFEELAAWKMLVPKLMDPRGERNALTHLRLGIRLGPNPHWVASTTPKTKAEIIALTKDPRVIVTTATMNDNPHLSDAFKEEMRSLYAGTRLGRQELDGELLTDDEEDMFPREAIEEARMEVSAIGLEVDRPSTSGDPDRRLDAGPSGAPVRWPDDGEAGGDGPVDPTNGPRVMEMLGSRLRHVSIGVDPSGGAVETGIVVVGLVGGGRRKMTPEEAEEAEREGRKGRWAYEGCPCGVGKPSLPHLWILCDATVNGVASSNTWAERTLGAWVSWRADRVVAERNYGGEIVESTLINVRDGAGSLVPFEFVNAARGKKVRAEPFGRMAEQRRLHMVGALRMAHLEVEATEWDGQSTGLLSPNRLDAMVWAAQDCMDVHNEEVEKWGKSSGPGALGVATLPEGMVFDRPSTSPRLSSLRRSNSPSAAARRHGIGSSPGLSRHRGG